MARTLALPYVNNKIYFSTGKPIFNNFVEYFDRKLYIFVNRNILKHYEEKKFWATQYDSGKLDQT